LGLPIAKNLIDLHVGTFTLKSKLRIGTEVVVTFPRERVMSALAPITEGSPPLQPRYDPRQDRSHDPRPDPNADMSSSSSSPDESISRARRTLFSNGG
jgi:two-component system cell cycle sensor histidine kinase PleC